MKASQLRSGHEIRLPDGDVCMVSSFIYNEWGRIEIELAHPSADDPEEFYSTKVFNPDEEVELVGTF